MAKKSAGKKGGKESLVVGSKVRAYIKSKKCKTSSELLEALNDRIHGLLNDAVGRCTANRRSTIKAQDI